MREMLRQGLKRFLGAEPARYARGRRNATIIAISSQKGGVGKTTTTVSLGAALARFHGRATLILDMDAQGHVHESLREHVVGQGGRLSSILLSSSSADVLDSIVSTTIANLHITPADRHLSETESLLATKIGKEFILRDALKYTRTHYDFILIDCPPNLGNLTLNALVAADAVLIPCDPSPLAISGVGEIIRTMATINERLNRDLDILGILLTRIDGRNRTVNEAVERELRRDYGDLVLDNTIGVNTGLAKSQFSGTSIYDYDPESRAALQYRKVAQEMMARMMGSVLSS
ncbi:MAG: ParA family protein [Bradymonadales bacterium]|nr:ParA family protein [Bradymonadales bacterium]